MYHGKTPENLCDNIPLQNSDGISHFLDMYHNSTMVLMHLTCKDMVHIKVPWYCNSTYS